MQKGKHWNAKYWPKPQLWSLHRDVFKARHCWGNCHNTNVWSISLPRRTMFFKDDLDNICYSACHLDQEIPKLEPRNPPRKLSHTSSRTESTRKKRGTVRRKTIWGKNLTAAQLEARTEEKGNPGASPQATKPGTSALTARWRESPWKTTPNNQKRSW